MAYEHPFQSNNSHHAPHPPAPSPTSASVLAPAPHPSVHPHERRIAVQRPTITTALAPPPPGTYLPTPASATSLSTPFSPYATATSSISSFPSTASRGSSPLTTRPMMAYNPQEWTQRAHHGGGAYASYSNPAMGQSRNREITGMEASMPSPPPPYSPSPNSASINQNVHASPAMSSSPFGMSQVRSPSSATTGLPTPGGDSTRGSPSSATATYDQFRSAAAVVQHQSPIPTQAPSFPPPPPRNGRDRSSSRAREGQRSIFSSFSALTHRNRSGESSGQQQQQQQQSAIDSLRHNTTEALSRAPAQPAGSSGPSQAYTFNLPRPEANDIMSNVRAPTARRAASTGAIGFGDVAMRQRPQNESSSNAPTWEPRMQLPPPPPGPPPSGSRSQSMSRTTDRLYTSERDEIIRPIPRQPQFGGSLGPIPPTPAGWTEEQNISRSRSPAARGLHIETGYTEPPQSTVARLEEHSGESFRRRDEPQTAHPTSTGLTRTPARREPSARGIRERRSESRAERDRVLEVQSAIEPPARQWPLESAAKPSDLVLPPKAGAISHRRQASRTTPGSGSQMTIGSSASGSFHSDDNGPDSSHSTPRQDSARPRVVDFSSPTPPLSSASIESFGSNQARRYGKSPAMPSQAPPSPPIHPPSAQSLDARLSALTSQSSGKDRPYSHILSTPNDEMPMHVPLQPSRRGSEDQSTHAPHPTASDDFGTASIERFKTFIARESAAITDRERLELFAEFMVGESRIRRDRYSAAFDSMASDIFDLTRDMWRSYNTAGRRSTTPNATSTPHSLQPSDSILSRPSTTEPSETFSIGESSRANYTPRTQSESPSSTTSATSKGRNRSETPLLTGFQPCLSPIPSMAQSTVPDDDDSRGRTASRWWEASADGSSGRGGKRIELSKRESKYMGLPPEAREYLQWDDDRSGGGTPGPSQPNMMYGPNEYPPEKTGFHEAPLPPPPPHPRPSSFYGSFGYHSAPTTPDPFKLDVSRLVTLPPPYPRHYPAVNNNHPDLTSIRANLRALSELGDVTTTKEQFKEKILAQREVEKARTIEARNHLRYSIQERIRSNDMSFADAAKEEADFDIAHVRRAKERAQAEFEAFQSEVVGPLHALYSERITKAGASIEHVRHDLSDESEDPSPNQTQEGGDEQPELLEKLTLLKWLFEVRENLHKGLFDLEGEGNDYYKAVIVTPYRLAGKEQKVREAEEFFSRDAQDRRVAFEKDTLRRYEEFMTIIEANVTRGVEIQLSAFWDIAPGLLAVVQKVPTNLNGFEILIPPQEYEENPVYHDFPMQYLFTLLAHAEKSAYQFIESQTNLLCLLHEVKSGVMVASSRLLETQQYLASDDFASIDQDMMAVREHEERRLTEDLKEKVALVEGQWGEALGKGLKECKDRVQAFLMERGGWDESL